MSPALETRILQELSSNLASSFEGMTGARPEAVLRGATGAPQASALVRRQSFAALPGALWIAAEDRDWNAGGGLVLEAAGLTETDGEKIKSEFLEIINQALSGVARAMSAWRGREVRLDASTADSAPSGISWNAIELKQGETRFALLAGIEPELFAAFEEPTQALEPAREKTPTFDLLLDVELPISVSFGRAQVPLKDVLKLTTGSIVELDRAIGDPVEVIVNNCVIARGEVVTVEGNFGVRIREVVSRQERWKTVG